MKTPVRTRLLSALLSLVMLVSLLPVSVFAAEPASGTWEKVTEAQEDWSGQYLIVYEKGSLIMDGSLSALDKEGNKVDVTITDGKIVGDYAKYAFTIAPMTGGWSIQSASGKYISGKSGSNKIITGSTPELNTITFADGNVKIASNNTTLQYNAAATNGTRFRYYKSENQQPVALYKLSTAPTRQSGIVTDLTTLQNGDKVVVFNPANKKALSSVYNGFYNTGVDVELTGGKLTGYTDAELWTVNRTESGAYTFSTAEGKKLSMDTSYSSTPLDKANVDWELSAAATADCFYIKNVGRGSYLEWYAEKNNWSSYGTIGSNEALFAQQLYLVADPQEPGQPGQPEDPSAPLKNGDQVVIYNPANLKALSSEYTGFYNKGTDVTLTNGKLSGYTKADIWTVGVNADGSYTFSTADGKKLSMDEKYSSTPLDKTHTGWSILPAATENCVYIQNVGRSSYLEWYAEKNNWSAFGTIGSNEALFAQQLYLVGDEMDQPAGSLPQEGAQVVLFNQNAQGVLAQQNDNTDSPAINSVSAQITDGKAIPENGGVVFTVERSGEYYRFRNETYGYLCSNGTGNNAFYSQTASEDADWTVEPCSGGVGGYQLESRTAKFNGRYSQYLEYYSDSYKTYSMYNVTDYTIYSFFFYGVADSVKLDGGVVNDPAVVFTSAETVKAGQDYTLTFTVNDVKAVSKLEILVDGKAAGVITDYTADGKNYTANIPAAMLAGADKVTLTVRVTNASGASYSGSLVLTVVDEPSIGAVTPLKGSQTGSDKRPVISAEIINAGENPTLEMTVNGQRVNAVYAGGKLTYTPAADMTDGRTNVTVTVTRADGKTASFNWFFTLGQAQYQLYFGQLHSHTQYSDGAGSLDAALDYVKNLPESANVQFVAFTDHSNYFDTTGAANPEGALYDMSLASASSQETWNSYRSSVAAFNEANAGSLVALAGFEMTWSGGPGHINTFNTPGIVSRNNSTLNNKTDYAGMRAYYALLSQQEGADSLSQFNHPGNTFGTFGDFAFWDPVIDSRMYMVEAGNGEGQIGAGGYYPSYEYYTMALDKGWHLAPTNNQDNHKGRWGNANDARDVILTDDFSEQGIYDALRAMRMYATEDKNLEIGYTVNGMLLGSSLTEVPEKLNIHVTVNDPDASDSISKVEVIVNSGKTAYTWDDPAVLATGDLSVTLDPDYSYYYIRVTQGDGDLAVTAPSRRLADAQTDPRTYSAQELAAIAAFNAGGGTVILAGWSDNYENYDVIQNNPAIKHMAATQNEVLQALGSSLRISDDATYDDVRSAADGVDKWRLYFNTYGQSFLTDGVIVDAEHPYDRLYTEVFSHYGGASVYAVDADGKPTSTLPATVSPVVYAHSTTYSVDVDKDGLGGANVPKYAYAENDSRLLAMASEQLEGKGLIIVSGAAFMSNFEVQATISDNGSEKNYSNYKICENLLRAINPVKVTDIATVQAQTEAGHKYTIEGVVTSNASGYDKATAFFDCIYVQDETGGINCFPVAGDFKIGDVVRVTGVTETYQGENELQVSSIEKIGETTPVTPKVVTSTQINDGSVLGQLVTLKGFVVGYEMADGLVQTILVRDSEGKIARVFIDGYITTSYDVKNLEIGCEISATGLASYDNTFVLADGTEMAPRIRIRDRNDVVCTAHEHTFGEWVVTTAPTCTQDGLETRTCSACGEVETRVIPAAGHDYKDGKCTVCGAADPGYQPTQPGVKTGDESNTTMWIIVLVCAAALAVVLVIVSRKKRNS